jgi:hypothetical protein
VLVNENLVILFGINDSGAMDFSRWQSETYNTRDVLEICNVSDARLHNTLQLKPCLITLQFHSKPRQHGKPRKFSVDDVVRLATLFATHPVGFPQKYCDLLCDAVARRARARVSDVKLDGEDLIIITWPDSDDDWHKHFHFKGQPMPQNVLDLHCAIYLNADEMITKLFAKLDAIAEARAEFYLARKTRRYTDFSAPLVPLEIHAME